MAQRFVTTLGTCSNDFFDYKDILSFNNQNVKWGEIINKVLCIHWNESRKYKKYTCIFYRFTQWINTDCWNISLFSGHTLTYVSCYFRHNIVAGMHRYIRPAFPASNNMAFVLHPFDVCTSTTKTKSSMYVTMDICSLLICIPFKEEKDRHNDLNVFNKLLSPNTNPPKSVRKSGYMQVMMRTFGMTFETTKAALDLSHGKWFAKRRSYPMMFKTVILLKGHSHFPPSLGLVARVPV